MVKPKIQACHKRKYSKISLQKRQRLVKMVLEQKKILTKAAKLLSIKICTARIIIQKYKEKGQFPMKNFRRHSQGMQKNEIVVNQQQRQSQCESKFNEDVKYSQKPEQLTEQIYGDGLSYLSQFKSHFYPFYGIYYFY